MSSVPMAGSGDIHGISFLGCNAESNDRSTPQLKTPHVHQSNSQNNNEDSDEAAPLTDALRDRQGGAVPTADNGNAPEIAKNQKLRNRKTTTSACVNGSQQVSRCVNGNATNGSPAGSNVTNGSGNGADASEEVTAVPFKLHRIREVREQQGLSVRSIARRIGIDVKSYRRLEDPTHDLTLSELHAVQVALDVPFSDLLIDRHCLSQPVKERAQLVRVMKSAVAIREAKPTPRVERLATMLCEQLTDLMPELAEVSGWPQFGARRGQSALGKALRQPIDTSQIGLGD